MILEIDTKDSTAYWEIDESTLERIAKMPFAEREAVLNEQCKPARVHSDEEVDEVLVLDGDEDEASWQELIDAWGW